MMILLIWLIVNFQMLFAAVRQYAISTATVLHAACLRAGSRKLQRYNLSSWQDGGKHCLQAQATDVKAKSPSLRSTSTSASEGRQRVCPVQLQLKPRWIG